MAKSSRIKVPKRVAGVKIPKAVRKGPIMDFVNSSAGKMLIAQALTAAIGALAYKQLPPETRERAGKKVEKGITDSREVVARTTARLSFAFSEAVTAFRRALDDQAPESGGERVEPVAETARGKKKKVSWSSSEPVNPH